MTATSETEIYYDPYDFEIDADDYAATGRLLARRPGTRVWLMRAGRAAAYRMGGAAAGRGISDARPVLIRWRVLGPARRSKSRMALSI